MDAEFSRAVEEPTKRCLFFGHDAVEIEIVGEIGSFGCRNGDVAMVVVPVADAFDVLGTCWWCLLELRLLEHEGVFQEVSFMRE